jgi:hypothetical protein
VARRAADKLLKSAGFLDEAGRDSRGVRRLIETKRCRPGGRGGIRRSAKSEIVRSIGGEFGEEEKEVRKLCSEARRRFCGCSEQSKQHAAKGVPSWYMGTWPFAAWYLARCRTRGGTASTCQVLPGYPMACRDFWAGYLPSTYTWPPCIRSVCYFDCLSCPFYNRRLLFAGLRLRACLSPVGIHASRHRQSGFQGWGEEHEHQASSASLCSASHRRRMQYAIRIEVSALQTMKLASAAFLSRGRNSLVAWVTWERAPTGTKARQREANARTRV